MRRVRRWLRRIVLGMVAGVVVAVVAALIVVHTRWGRELVRAQVEAALRGAFPGGAKLGALEGSVLGELVVRDVELRARDGSPLVSIKTLRLELSLLPLLGKTARIDALIAEDVVAHVRNQPAGEPEPAGSPLAWTIELPRIEVHRAAVVIETATGVHHLDAAALVASANAPVGLPLTASALINGTWRERAAPITGAVVVRVLRGDIRIPAAMLGVGGVTMVASDLRIDEPAGTVMIAAPAAAVEQLAPGVDITHDAFATISATPATSGSRITIAGGLGASSIHGALIVDVAALAARGVISAERIDVTGMTRSQLVGRGNAVVGFVADRARVRGTVIASGAFAGVPAGHAVIAFDAAGDRASAMMVGAGDGGAVVAGVGTVHRIGTRIELPRARLVLAVRDPAAASAGYVRVTGRVGADVTATGAVVPLAVDVTGTVRGTGLAFDELAASSVGARFSVHAARAITGTSHVEVTGVTSARRPVGSVSLDAALRSDGKIDVTARATPSAAGFVLDAAAVVTPGAETEIAIGPHQLLLPTGGIWAGRGGHVHVGRDQISIAGLSTASGGGRLDIDATVGRGTGVLGATVTATAVPVALLDPAYRGTVNGKLAISRRSDRWTGGGTLVGAGIALSRAVPPIDGEARITLAGRRVKVDVSGRNPSLGGGHVALEVDGLRDVTDLDEWKAVSRGDLKVVTIDLDHLDAAVLSNGRSGGIIDGKLELRDGEPSGGLRIRGVPTPAGLADGDLGLALTDPGFVDVKANARIGAIGRADLGVRIEISPHPFDPATWKRLGTGVIAQATATAKDVVIGPALFGAFGVQAPYRGRATGELVASPGLTAIHASLDVRDLQGGLIRRGIDAHLEGDVDANGTRGQLRVTANQQALLDVTEARTPVTLERWLAAPRSAQAAPVAAKAVIPSIDARELLAIVGRADLASGTLAGSVTVGGTLRTPTANAELSIRDVKVKQPIAGKVVPTLTALRVGASWGGATGTLTMTGNESNTGELRIELRGRPDQLASVFGTVDVEHFELSPIAAFLPGALVGASGQLDAALTVRGLDASLGIVRGDVRLTAGRIPLAPKLGTLRNTDARLTIADTGITAKLDGKLGAGAIHLDASSGLDGVTTILRGKVTKVSPIGALQPVINASIDGTLQRAGTRWTGTLHVTNASVLVPEQTGTKLLDAAEPADLIFVDVGVPPPPPVARAPEHPFVIADVTIDSSPIEIPDFGVHASASGSVTVSVGETIGMDGEIVLERGDADIFGHRYALELGQVLFDGSIDPEFNVKLVHEFPDVTMYVRLYGRASNPQAPEFTSNPGIYTSSQLLGFFLGGEPGGDPSKQTREAATGATSSLLSTALGKRIKKYLPFDLQVLRCNSGGGQITASCTGGTWLTRKLFLSYKRKINARPDESKGDIQLEYDWTRNWSIEATGGDLNYYGGDLLWRKRW